MTTIDAARRDSTRFKREKSGFTLIELSIVLVIIGLVVGAILVGKDLINAARLRAVLTEKESIETAINTFRLKYNCLPGDCPNATTFWGQDTAWDIYYGYKTTADGTLTANGNGDGIIGNIISTSDEYRYENYTAWQHLSNAGLVNETLNGVNELTFTQFTPGSNVASSKTSKDNGWVISWLPSYYSGWSPLFLGSYGSSIILIKRDPQNGQQGWANGLGAVTPSDQLSIDGKIDDGKPGRGLLRGQPNGGYGLYCVGWTQNDPDTATYNQAYTSPACSPLFLTKAF